MKIFAAGIVGFLVALLVASVLGLASGVVFNQRRLITVLEEAFSRGSLTDQYVVDSWNECAQLNQQFVRNQNIVINAIETRWIRPTHNDTCAELKALVAGPPYAVPLRPAEIYANYPSGPRHLQAIALSVMSVSIARALYGVLSYASIIALIYGAWHNSRRLALCLVLPIAAVLTFAFEQPLYSHNTMWAPAFFIGFFALAAFLALPRFFSPMHIRMAFFCFLGALTAYFDMMQGSIPVLLSLTIALNQCFYGQARGSRASLEAIAIAACFLLSFVGLTAIRLALLAPTDGFGLQAFISALSVRTDNIVLTANGTVEVHFYDTVTELWFYRSLMTGNTTTATLLLLTGFFAWIVVGVIMMQRRGLANPRSGDIIALAIASMGILAWYPIFPNHSFVHAWLMVRMLSLPAAYGFSAALLCWIPARQVRTAYA